MSNHDEERPLGIEPNPKFWINVNGMEYPIRMVQFAIGLMRETGDSWEEIMADIVMFDNAERNPTPVDSNEKIIGVFINRRKEKFDE